MLESVFPFSHIHSIQQKKYLKSKQNKEKWNRNRNRQ